MKTTSLCTPLVTSPAEKRGGMADTRHISNTAASVLRPLVWTVLVLTLFVPDTTSAGPIGIEAKVLKVFRVLNDARDGDGNRMAVDDYHIVVQHVGPGDLNLVRGRFGTEHIAAGQVTGNGTPTVTIDIDAAVGAGAFARIMKLEFVQQTNAVRVTESYWTIKDIAGDSIRVPEAQKGNAKVPGFEVKGDPEYTLFNDFNEPIGIRDLRFLVNAPELPFDSLDPGAMPGFGSPLPDFVLAPHSALTLFVPGDLDPGMFFYAQGLLFDPLFMENSGAFLHGHQAAVPEPATLALCGIGVGALLYQRRRSRSSANRSPASPHRL